MRRAAVLALLPLLLSMAVSACTRAQARVNPELPPLDVPAPPPRNVEAAQPEQPLPVIAVQEPVTTTPANPPRTPQPAAQQRPDTPRPEPPRVEQPPPPSEPPKPVEDVRGQPPATLQTTPSEREVEVERGILDTLTRARATLNRVDYRALNTDAQRQYDSAL